MKYFPKQNDCTFPVKFHVYTTKHNHRISKQEGRVKLIQYEFIMSSAEYSENVKSFVNL